MFFKLGFMDVFSMYLGELFPLREGIHCLSWEVLKIKTNIRQQAGCDCVPGEQDKHWTPCKSRGGENHPGMATDSWVQEVGLDSEGWIFVARTVRRGENFRQSGWSGQKHGGTCAEPGSTQKCELNSGDMKETRLERGWEASLEAALESMTNNEDLTR